MKWSLRVATVAGTEVRIHITFLLLLAFVAYQGMSGGRGVAGAMEALIFISAVFFCVVLHEFGHVFAARGYGIRTPDITLLPIGGLARLERMPRKPSQELVVALCGPLVNVAIASAILIGLGLHGRLDGLLHFGAEGRFWENLMVWNIIMVVFNMVPAFPMDGGRVLRALLAMWMDYGKATRTAASLGQAIALGAVIWMLLSGSFQPILLLIAFFVFMAASQEAAVVTQQEATQNMRVRDAMLTEFHVLPPDASLREGVEMLLAGSQHDFPVLGADRTLLGLLSRTRLISSLADFGPEHRVEEVMEPCKQSVVPLMPLNEAMELLNASQSPAIPVLDSNNGHLVGLLTAENVGETLMVRAALRQARDKSA